MRWGDPRAEYMAITQTVIRVALYDQIRQLEKDLDQARRHACSPRLDQPTREAAAERALFWALRLRQTEQTLDHFDRGLLTLTPAGLLTQRLTPKQDAA